MEKLTIKNVSRIMGISTYTLRYYEKIGLLDFVDRDKNGVREFKPSDLLTLNTIECLKKTDMPLKDIKKYLNLVKEGITSAKERQQMFQKQKQKVENQIKELEVCLQTINKKLNYYNEVIKHRSLDVCLEERKIQLQTIINNSEKNNNSSLR